MFPRIEATKATHGGRVEIIAHLVDAILCQQWAGQSKQGDPSCFVAAKHRELFLLHDQDMIMKIKSVKGKRDALNVARDSVLAILDEGSEISCKLFASSLDHLTCTEVGKVMEGLRDYLLDLRIEEDEAGAVVLCKEHLDETKQVIMTRIQALPGAPAKTNITQHKFQNANFKIVS